MRNKTKRNETRETKLEIVVGTTSEHKIKAVKKSCKLVRLKDSFVEGMKTKSGVNEQPVGYSETLQGAYNRAAAVKKMFPRSTAIGIESGIFRTCLPNGLNTTVDMAVIVILTTCGRTIIATTPAIRFPEELVLVAEGRGFATTTVGSVISEQFGGDPTDPHSSLTNGKVTRMNTLVEGLVIALSQI